MFLKRLKFRVFFVDKHATAAVLARSVSELVLAQYCLVSWMDDGTRLRGSPKLLHSVRVVTFVAIKTFSRRHKMCTQLSLELTSFHCHIGVVRIRFVF